MNGYHSPRPRSFQTYGSFDSANTPFGFAARFLPASLGGRYQSDDPLMQQEMDMTSILAARHGITDRRKMYFHYYFPFANWIRQYRWAYVKGDLVSAFTMASFYLPMSLSYAANLGHIPPINGLYSFAFNPFVYALLGTCPQMVVGPEAAGSLLTGQVVRENIKNGSHMDEDGTKNAQIAGMVTGLAGAVILMAGLCRLGFLDSVLSRPFLRGFISAIGIVIFVDQLIPEMGLDGIASHVDGAAHGSSLQKIMFLGHYWRQAHGLTCAVGFGSFAIVMFCREVKKRLQPKRQWVAYIPDRFLVVVLSAVFAWAFEWHEQGLDILGDIQAQGKPFKAHFPFEPKMLEHATDAFSTAILIALLGFFESSVAAKSLGVTPSRKTNQEDDNEPEGIKSMMVSPNRELVALGVANIMGGLFMALPAFGGYGRSKVNASTGGKTPMSSIFLSIITVICILFLLPYFYYIPILGRVPGSKQFENAEMHALRQDDTREDLEFIENTLIIKIPEPLTFANTGSLKHRLKRIEEYGAGTAHPGLPRLRRPDKDQVVIFDVHGVTGLDPAAAQVLLEIVQGYVDRGVKIFFCRVVGRKTEVWRLMKVTGIVDLCGGESNFVDSVQEALDRAEEETSAENVLEDAAERAEEMVDGDADVESGVLREQGRT
ncbi:hypothetical protein ANO11243_025390 [Dothideomycetidae sp. 11243]|nr:hypothetical protein ANO11243_025390 [fungal sp. No.11243]